MSVTLLDIDRLRFVIRRRLRRQLPPGVGDIVPLAVRYSRYQFEFEAPAIGQTAGAELIACRRRSLLDRLDQLGNPDGDCTK